MAERACDPALNSLRFDRAAQVKAALIAAAFVAAFWKLLDFIPPDYGALVWTWRHSSDWSHGPIIPLFSAYLVYTKWDQVRRCPVRFAWLGLPIMLIGLAGYAAALWEILRFGYAMPFSMMICLLGVIILLCGLPVMRYAWVPWLYLFFAVPLPQRIYFQITNPLRRWAAEFAATLLSVVPELQIERTGSVIDAIYRGTHHAIGVADACSGMRSTITLCALGVAIAFIHERPWWQRVILVASCLPIATFCNFLRVLITCFLYIFVDARYAEGTFHMMLGLVMLGVAFAIFSGLGWVMSNLFVEDEDDKGDRDGASAATAAAGS